MEACDLKSQWYSRSKWVRKDDYQFWTSSLTGIIKLMDAIWQKAPKQEKSL